MWHRAMANYHHHYQHEQNQHRVGHFQTPTGAHQHHFQQCQQYHLQVYKNLLTPWQAIPAKPKVFPNNTLVEDLSKCHLNLWPRATRATSRTIELIKACLPRGGNKTKDKKTTAKDQQQVDSNSCANLSDSQLKLHHQNGLDLECGQQFDGGQRVPPTANSLPDHYRADYFDVSWPSQFGKKKQLKMINGDHHQQNHKSLNYHLYQNHLHRPIVPKARARRKFKFPMPASISRLNSTLTQDDYNRALGVLASDMRFQLHIFLYRRLQSIWILFTTILCIFLPLLLNIHLEAFVISSVCSLWLLLQIVGLAIGGSCRRKLDQMLERSVAQVNSYFMDHKLMLGVINVGGLCKRSRLVIPMVYFDTFECIEQIESIISADLKSIEIDKANDKKPNQQQHRQMVFDHSKNGFHQLEANQRAVAKSQLAKKIVLRFSQRWISQFDRGKLMFTDEGTRPRHLSTGKCLCQFIEESSESGKVDELTIDIKFK